MTPQTVLGLALAVYGVVGIITAGLWAYLSGERHFWLVALWPVVVAAAHHACIACLATLTYLINQITKLAGKSS